MRGLATWSGRRVLTLCLAWFGLLVGLVALDVRRQWPSQVPGAVFKVPDSTMDSLARQGESAATVAGQSERLRLLPEQHTDFVFSVVGDPTMGWLEPALILLGPPGFLTVLWLYARHRRRS